MHTVTEGVNVTTEEAGRLATGLVGAAAADREEARAHVSPPTWVGGIDMHLYPGARIRCNPYTTFSSAGGWVSLGPLHLHGEWDVLEATLVAALDAVRAARQGPVGA